jgi:hypothetical protein
MVSGDGGGEKKRQWDAKQHIDEIFGGSGVATWCHDSGGSGSDYIVEKDKEKERKKKNIHMQKCEILV